MAKLLKQQMNPAAQANLRHNCLTSNIAKCARQGVASAGFRDTFEQFHDTESRVEETGWQIKHWIMENVQQWSASEVGGRLEWHPILYTGLLSNTHLGGEADNFIGLVMTDSTLERFLVFNYYDVDDFPKYHALNECRAKELMSLLLYLGVSNPQWVRSTYIVPYATSFPIVDLLLPLATLDALPTDLPELAAAPATPPEIKAPIVHVSTAAGQDGVPAGIKSASFPRIERVLFEAFGSLPELGGGPEGRRERRPRVTQAGSTMCEECGIQVETLLRYSACKLAFFCGPACQTKGWPYHRFFCKSYVKKLAKATSATTTA